MERDPDLDLVRGLSSADPAEKRRALGDLFERYRARVYNVAYRVMGNEPDAADVAQEVFLSAADRIATFRGKASFASWMYRLAFNHAIDARRSNSRRWRRTRGADDAGVESETESRRPGVSDPDGDPEAAAAARERDARIHEVLDRLSPLLRTVVILRYFEGLTYEEIASVLETNVGTVKSRLNRAHASLAEILGPEAGPGGG
jgi:RNA polymerase sigma-70 factor (ECF subfamily)